MQRLRFIWVLSCFLVLQAGACLKPPVVRAADRPPAVGEPLPDIQLQPPDDPDLRRYLGISGDRPFHPAQIDAEVVIIEIFSMYCPHCQREAPKLNKVFQDIEKDPNLRGRVKMIGIGVGNSAFEVGFFKKTYKVPFPLFPDKTLAIHSLLGGVRTPYFIGIRIDRAGGHRVVYAQLGGMESPEQFIQAMMTSSER